MMLLPLKSLSLLGLSPITQCSACRIVPLFSQQDLRPQCFPSNAYPSYTLGGQRPFFRASSTNPAARPSSTTSGGFSYRIGASFSAKGRRFVQRTDYYSHDPTKGSRKDYNTGGPTSGQDAFFVSRIGNSSSMAFGVADGVGGWSESGIDSAYFSHGLCEHMIRVAENTEAAEKDLLSAQKLLQKAYDAVVADESISGGGSTACVAVGSDSGHLQVANLGDSGFAQLRLNAVHHYSNPQTHAFNTPYQLSIIPPKVLARARIFGGDPLSDYPVDASVTTHQLRHGDVLVFATDGLWDNLNSTDVLRIASRYMIESQAWKVGQKGVAVSENIRNLTLDGGIRKDHETNLQTLLAVAITGEAKMASLNSKRDGPFAREVKKFYPGEDYHGGKVDDICVVVAVVMQD
ncbi:MAG: hypothetical protein Q9191_005637 [Dirinaria sp. TL-2023a]